MVIPSKKEFNVLGQMDEKENAEKKHRNYNSPLFNGNISMCGHYYYKNRRVYEKGR
jgi:hypothetical protein